MTIKSRLTLIGATLLLANSSIALALDEGVRASVNGSPIMQSMIESVAAQLQANGQQADEERIIDELINLQLLAELAKNDGLDKREDIANVLQLQRNQILANTYMSEISKDISVSDEEMQKEYDKQTANVKSDEFNASHILLESEEDAKAVIAALADGGDFAELAKEKSTGPSGPNGGELGWFKADTMVPEFAAAVQQMEAGSSSSEPVKTEFGWHVIKLNETRGTPVPEFEEVKPQIENVLVREQLTAKIAKLREAANIEIAE